MTDTKCEMNVLFTQINLPNTCAKCDRNPTQNLQNKTCRNRNDSQTNRERDQLNHDKLK